MSQVPFLARFVCPSEILYQKPSGARNVWFIYIFMDKKKQNVLVKDERRIGKKRGNQKGVFAAKKFCHSLF
ncbi:4743_t:CDS:2 [Funneliformis mosseae]|uniref:4743_t:CDS:1 n=1 Tax=Funneliformis mosseae TaxID=27381 RepID=A0A9N9C1Y8_FUNMO|nr:4743_t:CDS:2 [Funneliformis mosseae]